MIIRKFADHFAEVWIQACAAMIWSSSQSTILMTL